MIQNPTFFAETGGGPLNFLGESVHPEESESTRYHTSLVTTRVETKTSYVSTRIRPIEPSRHHIRNEGLETAVVVTSSGRVYVATTGSPTQSQTTPTVMFALPDPCRRKNTDASCCAPQARQFTSTISPASASGSMIVSCLKRQSGQVHLMSCFWCTSTFRGERDQPAMSSRHHIHRRRVNSISTPGRVWAKSEESSTSSTVTT